MVSIAEGHPVPKKVAGLTTSSGVVKGNPLSRLHCVFAPAVVFLVVVNIAVFLILPIAFKGRYPYRLETLGTDWGPLVFDGQWWRLLTCFFVHFEFSHLFFNMLALWILGWRMEREFGRWMFLFFYLTCGLVVSLVVLALNPFMASVGASGAIAGLAGGIITVYGPRFRFLSWGTRAKLGLVILCSVGLVWRELSRGDLYLPHTTGLCAGAILGGFLVYVARGRRARAWTVIGTLPLFVIAAILVQRHHR